MSRPEEFLLGDHLIVEIETMMLGRKLVRHVANVLFVIIFTLGRRRMVHGGLVTVLSHVENSKT